MRQKLPQKFWFSHPLQLEGIKSSQSEEWVNAVTAFSPRVKIHKTEQPTIRFWKLPTENQMLHPMWNFGVWDTLWPRKLTHHHSHCLWSCPSWFTNNSCLLWKLSKWNVKTWLTLVRLPSPMFSATNCRKFGVKRGNRSENRSQSKPQIPGAKWPKSTLLRTATLAAAKCSLGQRPLPRCKSLSL